MSILWTPVQEEILRPGMLLESQKRVTQPSVPRINWSNPITKQLASAIPLGLSNNTPIDLVTKCASLTSYVPSSVVTGSGRAAQFDGNLDHYLEFPVSVINCEFTILVVASHVPGGLSEMIAALTDTITYDSHCGVAYATWYPGWILTNFAVGNGYGFALGPTSPGKTAVMVVRRNNVYPRPCTGVRDGVDWGGGATYTSETSFNSLVIGKNKTATVSNQAYAGSCSLVLMWKRYLTTNECIQISNNPWSIFL